MKLSEKKSRQAAVYTALKAASMSRAYQHDTDGLRFGRADFDSLPRGYTQPITHPEFANNTRKLRMPFTRKQRPMFVNLLETSLAGARPSKERLDKQADTLGERYPDETRARSQERARNIMDLGAAVRKRAHDELLDPNREARLQTLHEAGAIKKYGHSKRYNQIQTSLSRTLRQFKM